MQSLELALRYMDIVFDGEDMELLRPLLSGDFSFQGPSYEFDTAQGYIASMQAEPPEGFAYEIINAFENGSSVCLVYQFSKPGISVPMAQLFETRDGKISRILLIFDTGAFG